MSCLSTEDKRSACHYGACILLVTARPGTCPRLTTWEGYLPGIFRMDPPFGELGIVPIVRHEHAPKGPYPEKN